MDVMGVETMLSPGAERPRASVSDLSATRGRYGLHTLENDVKCLRVSGEDQRERAGRRRSCSCNCRQSERDSSRRASGC